MSFSKHGGARVGAGRPRRPKNDREVPHARRPELSGREAIHVTLRFLEHVYNLRTRRCFEIVSAALLAVCNQLDFRVVAFSLQGNHLHMLIEAACASALSKGVRRLAVRIARGLNLLMGRHGPVFERFHARRLTTPRDVRTTLAYILRNTTKHAAQVGRPLPPGYRDPYTAGYFGAHAILPPGTECLVAPPETWLLQEGWRRVAGSGACWKPAPSPAAREMAPLGGRLLPLLDAAARVGTHPLPEPGPEPMDRAICPVAAAWARRAPRRGGFAPESRPKQALQQWCNERCELQKVPAVSLAQVAPLQVSSHRDAGTSSVSTRLLRLPAPPPRGHDGGRMPRAAQDPVQGGCSLSQRRSARSPPSRPRTTRRHRVSKGSADGLDAIA
jgi:REP element-mobilizing transposase RayT